jgi:hypothetical protein
MVKLVFLCWRRLDISHERYVELLLRGHVPIALAHHPTLRRYVVNVVEGTRRPELGPAPALDSIGELWFDSLADYRERLYDSPEGARVVADDVAGFLGGAHAYVTTEHAPPSSPSPPPLGVRSPGGKLVVCVARPSGLGQEEFRRHWRKSHLPRALGHAAATGYVTSVVEERLGEGGPDYDGVATLRFASDEECDGGLSGGSTGATVTDPERTRFLGTIHAYRVVEYVERR